MKKMPIFAAVGIVILMVFCALPPSGADDPPSQTFTVTTTADTMPDGSCDAHCTLREAIIAANRTTNAVINIPAGTYTLSITGFNEDDAATGDLDIRSSMTIVGGGAETTIIDGVNADRIFHIHAGAIATLSGVTITGGDSTVGEIALHLKSGGGIRNEGTLALSNSIVRNNKAPISGGIHNGGGTLILDNVKVLYNEASFYGGIYHASSLPLTIQDSTIYGNQATGGSGGGIASDNSVGSMTIEGTTIGVPDPLPPECTADPDSCRNTATAQGGGVWLGVPRNPGTGETLSRVVTITNSTISGNRAVFGAGIYIASGNIATLGSADAGIEIKGNEATSTSQGGGIYNASGLILTRGVIKNNTSSSGGGIYNTGAGISRIIESTFDGNIAADGGGAIWSDASGTTDTEGVITPGLTIERSAMIRNQSPGYGGGIYNGGGILTFDGGFITSNTAADGGGGLYNVNSRSTGTLASTTLNNCRIDYNSATDTTNGIGGGIFNNAALTINLCTVNNNTAASYAGGLYTTTLQIEGGDRTINTAMAGQRVVVTDTTFDGNEAQGKGGAIVNYTGQPGKDEAGLTITGSSITNNRAGLAGGGGGIYNGTDDELWGALLVQNSTIGVNESGGQGGGIFIRSGDVELRHATVMRNSAKDGGGFYMSSGGYLTTVASIIATNVSSRSPPSGPDCFTTTGARIRSLGYNVLQRSSAFDCPSWVAHPTDHLNPTPPILADSPASVPGDFGGPTEVFPIIASNPGAGIVDQSFCLPTDQRGFTRNTARCDAGAFQITCGDGHNAGSPLEECDDGNDSETGNSDVRPDACRTDCRMARCGDRVTDTDHGETCDDGNTVTETCEYGQSSCGDVCSSICKWTAGATSFCGDGTTDAPMGETCDDGTSNGDPNHCNGTCSGMTPPTCSNRVIEEGEQCDDGGESAGCNSDCTFATCGDNITNITAGEQCDDENSTNEDGCSSTCRTEFCGDGTIQAGLGEACDDGNIENGDGCSSICVVEEVTATPPPAGEPPPAPAPEGAGTACGNGTLESGEVCDDGNTTSGDGCSETCTTEEAPPAESPPAEDGEKDGEKDDGGGCSLITLP